MLHWSPLCRWRPIRRQSDGEQLAVAGYLRIPLGRGHLPRSLGAAVVRDIAHLALQALELAPPRLLMSLLGKGQLAQVMPTLRKPAWCGDGNILRRQPWVARHDRHH